MKDVLNIEGVEHHVSKAPLTDHKVDRLIAYLEASNLKDHDTVILDLTRNFAPSLPMDSEDNCPRTTGKLKGKKFHIADS